MSASRRVLAKRGSVEREFDSVAACARALGCSDENVRRVLRGDGKVVRGHAVRYATEDEGGTEAPPGKVSEETPALLSETLRRMLNAKDPPLSEVEAGIRHLMRQITLYSARVTTGEADPPYPGWKAKDFIDTLKAFAESHGLDWKAVSDTRTEAQRIEDAIRAMLENPEESEAVFELVEPQLAMLQSQLECHLVAEGYLIEELVKAGHDPDTGRPAVSAPKCRADDCLIRLWAIVRRVKEMRGLVRAREHPDPAATPIQRFAFRACDALRLQLYCGRGTHGYEGMNRSEQADRIFRAPRYLVKTAVDELLARERAQITPHGLLMPGQAYRKPYAKQDSVFPGTRCEGMMQMLPPGHGKTVRISWVVTRRMLDDRSVQIGYVHASEEGAKNFVKMVRSHLDPNTAVGRRVRSFYAPFSFTRDDNDSTRIRIKTDNPSANPHLTGYSVDAKRLSNSLNELIFDDVVPQSDVTQPTERERRIKTVGGTWMTRVRGRGFKTFSGYFWHHGDLMFWLYEQARISNRTNGREGIPLLVSLQSVGGPRAENGRPAFDPIWPEGYPASALRDKFNGFHDKSIYYANFMMRAISDEDRIVKSVRFYDPEDEQNAEFEASHATERHISLDPSATVDRKSDSTGAIIAYIGDVVTRTERDGVVHETRVPRIRIRSAREFKATQQDITDAVVAEAKARPLDMVHIEVSGGYGTSTRDSLMNYHGVSNVTTHGTGNRNKMARLKACASMMEASGEFASPVVEFAGRRLAGENGEGEHWAPIDAGMESLVNQVVNVKVAAGLHTLDALTQLVNWAAANMGLARGGAVSAEVRRAEEAASRKRRDMESHFAAQERRRMGLDDGRRRIFDFCGV